MGGPFFVSALYELIRFAEVEVHIVLPVLISRFCLTKKTCVRFAGRSLKCLTADFAARFLEEIALTLFLKWKRIVPGGFSPFGLRRYHSPYYFSPPPCMGVLPDRFKRKLVRQEKHITFPRQTFPLFEAHDARQLTRASGVC